MFKLENPRDEDFRFAKTAVENIIVLKPTPERHGIGLGWFAALEASVHADSTNSAVAGPIATLKADKLSFTVNPFFEKTFGRNRVDGIALNYGWHAKYELKTGFAVGIEGFGLIENLGNPPPWSQQEHRVGPAIFLEFKLSEDVTITPDVGLFVGLTEATPDLTVKLNVGIPLRKPAAR